MKRFFLLFSLSILIFFYSEIGFSQEIEANEYKISTIVIDAGHGGKDPGAMSSGYKEKDIALSVALKFGALVEKHYPDIKVLYTRKTDVFIPLNKRAEIANKNHADIFISIHCNAAAKSNAKGIETFVLGLHKSDANLEVAKKENQSILYEDNYEENYGGYDPNSPENNIIFSLFQNAFLEQSLLLASNVQDCMGEINKVDRGVRQAGFLVLWQAAMPSILIETGFITNSYDRTYLTNTKGQQKIATAIFNGFSKTKANLEKTNNNVSSPVIIKHEPIETDVNVNTDATNQIVNKQTENNKEQVIYKVQFMTTSKKVNTRSGKYKKLKDVDYYKQGGKYKYTTGVFTNKESAQHYKAKVKSYGYKDAFIVKFKDGQRIK